MSTARLDESILPILENATDRVIIRAKDGRVLGVFEPTPTQDESIKSPASDAELRELQQNKGECIPLSEFWKRMGTQ